MGVQWGHGASGNVRWSGARLKDDRAKLGLRIQVTDILALTKSQGGYWMKKTNLISPGTPPMTDQFPSNYGK